jgi:predicted component of type VI protein secretion system
MKLTNKQLKQIIKEELGNVLNESRFSPTEIYMDLMRRGGPDYWLSEAHGRPMKCTSDVNYDQALRAYIDETDPSLNQMPDVIWSQITELMRNTN